MAGTWALRWWTVLNTWVLDLTINWTGPTSPSTRSCLLKTFYDCIAASTIHYTVCLLMCRQHQDRKKLVRRVNSVLGCSLDFVEEVGQRRMLAKLTSFTELDSGGPSFFSFLINTCVFFFAPYTVL